MNRREAAALLNYAAALDNRIGNSTADRYQAGRAINRWAIALADVPATTATGGWDAMDVVRRYYEQRGGDDSARLYVIEPHTLLAAWAEYRAGLLRRHTDPIPAVDPGPTCGMAG
jgi:hypothetical protein